jgi:ATP-dependent RNA helicase DDX49/DBP8
MAQEERQNALGRFRAEVAKILVATDLASRGLDIPEVSVVINYDLPRSPDDYIHRVGRTARAGRGGTSVCFVSERDVLLIKAIEERVGEEMPKLEDSEGVPRENAVIEVMQDVGEARRMALMMMDEEGWEENKLKRKRGP